MMENLSVPALEYASKALVDGAISLGKVGVIHFESMGPSTKSTKMTVSVGMNRNKLMKICLMKLITKKQQYGY